LSIFFKKIIACNAKFSEFGNGKQVQVSIHLEINPVVGPKPKWMKHYSFAEVF
jgi:hypothetical protein